LAGGSERSGSGILLAGRQGAAVLWRACRLRWALIARRRDALVGERDDGRLVLDRFRKLALGLNFDNQRLAPLAVAGARLGFDRTLERQRLARGISPSWLPGRVLRFRHA
jgi:hypothetical protein